MLSLSSEELLGQTMALQFWYKGSAPCVLLLFAEKLWKIKT